MLFVHVNPGYSKNSVISTGSFFLVGEVMVDWLGRASVAALSFLSGYLMLGALRRETLTKYASRRFQTLLIPMVAWNLIFIVGSLSLKSFKGQTSSNSQLLDLHWLATEATGIAGPTANLSLFFLRDIFISGCIGFLLAPALRRWPLPVLLVALLLTLFDCLEPLVFRPTILLFLLCGMASALHEIRLSQMNRLSVALPSMVVFAALAMIDWQGICNDLFGDGERTKALILIVASTSRDICKRIALLFAVLIAMEWIEGGSLCKYFLKLESSIFTIYLSHLPVFGTLWLIWRQLIGNERQTSYLIFFLLAPFAGLLVGRSIDVMLKNATPYAQKVFRGRVDRKT